ncbi:hypothetical protein ACS0TY_000594 [Phlomoides rotata]
MHQVAKSTSLRLPRDLIEEILSRLPVKSLLKFRCVSKSWRSLIDNNHFIKTHLQKSTTNANFSHHGIIVSRPYFHRTLMLVSWRSVLNYPFAFDEIINADDREVTIVGSCNGLVCILEDTGGFILWNPSTIIARNLPDVGVGENLVGDDFTRYGFGYDESSDDYKVFVIITLSCSPNVYRAISRLYSLKSNSWKTLKDKQDSDIQFEGGGTFASGNLHVIERLFISI